MGEQAVTEAFRTMIIVRGRRNLERSEVKKAIKNRELPHKKTRIDFVK